MENLTLEKHQLCDIQGRLFELALKNSLHSRHRESKQLFVRLLHLRDSQGQAMLAMGIDMNLEGHPGFRAYAMLLFPYPQAASNSRSFCFADPLKFPGAGT